MDLMPLKNAKRWEMGTRAWRRAFALTLGFVSFVTLISVVLSISKQQKYVILSPLYESHVKEGEARTEEFVFQPMFNLSALNAVCNLSIPEEVFTTCRNKVYPILNKVTNETQMAISPRIHVLGERHSATNLAAHLAVGNFELVFNKTDKLPKLPGIDFGINRHKHNIQNNGPYEKGLSIISIKNPYDYTRSMLKECYNCGPQEKNRGNPAAFVGTEWHLGAHVWQYHFANLMVMRKEKYCNYLEKAAELTDCIMLVHSEDNLLPIHQEHYVWRIPKMTGWPLKEDTIRTKSDYSGHSAGGGFQLSKLVDGITYFKTDYSTHEENVIHAVNDYMIDDFEKAFGYHRIQVPEKPPIKKAEPIKIVDLVKQLDRPKQQEPPKQQEAPKKQETPKKQEAPKQQETPKQQDPPKQQEAPSPMKFEPLKKDSSSKDDTPFASTVAGKIETLSKKALEDIENLEEGMQGQQRVEAPRKPDTGTLEEEDENRQPKTQDSKEEEVAGAGEKGDQQEEGNGSMKEQESEEEKTQERLERLHALLEYARRRQESKKQQNPQRLL